MYSCVSGSSELQELRVRRPGVPRRGARRAPHQVVLQGRLATRSQARGGEVSRVRSGDAAEEGHQGHDAVPTAHAAPDDDTTEGNVRGRHWNAEAIHQEGPAEQSRVRDIYVTHCGIACVVRILRGDILCQEGNPWNRNNCVNGRFETGYLDDKQELILVVTASRDANFNWVLSINATVYSHAGVLSPHYKYHLQSFSLLSALYLYRCLLALHHAPFTLTVIMTSVEASLTQSIINYISASATPSQCIPSQCKSVASRSGYSLLPLLSSIVISFA